MIDGFFVGAAELEITPPVGTALAGGNAPRDSVGVHDPLMLKVVVMESGGVILVYAQFDLIGLNQQFDDRAVRVVSEQTGIPEVNIFWSASHTHSGPYTLSNMASEECINQPWLDALPEKFAAAVTFAKQNSRSARSSRIRGFCNTVGHNRRLRFKDGRDINTWLVHRGEEDVQCLGAAAPIDPEICGLCFEDSKGAPVAVLWNYAVHTNSQWGDGFSADYPGVVASRLRERFGPAVISIYMPGAFADINPILPCREVGDTLATVILSQLDKRKPQDGKIKLGALSREVLIPLRDFSGDQEKRIQDSQWNEAGKQFFRNELEMVRKAGVTEARLRVHAWRVGDTCFVGLPGELFVEWGLELKEKSPFPWTIPVGLCRNYVGYLPTARALQGGGYEGLICRHTLISAEGVKLLIDEGLDMLGELWADQGR